MLSHIGYIEYCERLNLKTNIKDLNDTTTYYWHSNISSEELQLKFIRLNGNTFIFEMNDSKNKLGLSSENGIIYGVTTNSTKHTFNWQKYV
jgi:hypothetical protein